MPYSFDEFVALMSKSYQKKQVRYSDAHDQLSSWMDRPNYPTLEQYEEMYRNYLRSFNSAA